MGRALSENVKKQKARQLVNTKMAKALDEFQHNELRPKSSRESLRAIADRNNVARETLRRLAAGNVSMSAFNATKQKLSPAEERVLLDHILASADRGFPMTFSTVVAHANCILKSRNGEAINPESNWVHRFRDRHNDELQAHWSKPLDTQRAQSLNPAAVEAWFGLVKEFVADKNIRKEDIYGMDESGFPPSDQGTQRVLGRRGTKTQHKQGSGERENVTAIVCICADGTVLRPAIIYKGKNMMAKYGENNVSGAS
jgi:Tc5 transposase DNA-binding domain